VIISGPSGVGKSTITHHVERELGACFSVSMTTRPKTAADVEGRDYFFVDRQTFERAREAGSLLEWAEVFGYLYGTPREPVEHAVAEGKLVLLEIDVEGAVQVRQKMPEAFGLFVLPPNEQVLLERLRHRKREDESVIQRRFAKAKWEIERARSCGAYDAFLVNDDLAAAVAEATDRIERELRQRHGCPSGPIDSSA
jgi:guanylate kinase